MRTLLGRLRRPEYTGERRCWPCTAVNAALLAVGAVAVAVAGWPLVALGLAVVGSVLVALRGYVVPFTPRFAPRVAAALPWNPFHDPGPPGDPGSIADDPDEATGERVTRALVEAGVLVPEDERLLLDDGFHGRWRAAMADLREESLEDLAAAVEAETPVEGTDTLDRDGRQWVVLEDGAALLARPVAVAELAALRALEGVVDDRETRLAAVRPLRTFLRECPACGRELVESTADSCCGGPVNPREGPDEVLACPGCGQRLHTFPG